MPNVSIVSLGQIVADIVVHPVDGFPRVGTTDSVDRIDIRCGGCGLNTAMVLTKLGVPTAVIGKIGCDTFGEHLLRKMVQLGLDIRGVRQERSTRTSSVIVLISSTGERSFLYAEGGNEAIRLEDVDLSLLQEAQILHIGGIMKLPKLRAADVLKKAKEFGLVTSMDTDWDSSGKWLERIQDSLGYVDLFMPSLDEARLISGQEEPEHLAKFFFDYGVKTFILKMGDQGCYINNQQQEWVLPAYQVKVVDTTGAGDAFVGGFLAGYAQGWNLAECGRLANACGASCVTQVGTTEGIDDMTRMLEFMHQASVSRKIGR